MVAACYLLSVHIVLYLFNLSVTVYYGLGAILIYDMALAVTHRFYAMPFAAGYDRAPLLVDKVPYSAELYQSSALAKLETKVVERRNYPLVASSVAPQSVSAIERQLLAIACGRWRRVEVRA